MASLLRAERDRSQKDFIMQPKKKKKKNTIGSDYVLEPLFSTLESPTDFSKQGAFLMQ